MFDDCTWKCLAAMADNSLSGTYRPGRLRNPLLAVFRCLFRPRLILVTIVRSTFEQKWAAAYG
jgi:hypothetical protein